MKSQISDIDFYKNLFYYEYDRAEYYDKIIQYPTTLLIVFIGGALYSFNNHFKNGIPINFEIIDWIFLSLLLVFSISCVVTIIYLFSVFHGFTRKYGYLPYSKQLKERENDLLNFTNENKNKLGLKNDSEIIDKTKELFKQDLLQYYIELTNTNQIINDHRAQNYSNTRNLLFIDLLFFIIIGIIGLTF